MKILALDLSSNQHSAAVVEAAGNASILGEASEPGTRGSRAIGLIEAALKEAGVEREEIGCLATGLGPGSYTGIRASIAVAQGWDLAGNVRLVGISSADCIAATAHAQGFRGAARVIIDAQRNELYVGGYDLSDSGAVAVEALRLAAVAELAKFEQEGALLLGPEIHKWTSRGQLLHPRAGILGLLASRRQDFVPGERLEPIYLRETQFVKAPPPRVIPPL